ncbi:armadillo-type protein [Pisolithus orientalis]|uniref:armadillo-type protein n=1 Tax=Pisolithus orientalis TaxID=936130 RepID=UPI0022255297|nr:armadillo-type protein [Pisolithus orientalis]KAI6028785.1 armadillo-type protein [Pisolithus orientalis]
MRQLRRRWPPNSLEFCGGSSRWGIILIFPRWSRTKRALSKRSADCQPNYTDGDVTLMSVQAFTPILGTFLLSPNGMVSGPARYAVVELLGRIKKADAAEDEGVEGDHGAGGCGLFGRPQRRLFEDEVLHQIKTKLVDVWFDASARTPATEIPAQVSASGAVDQLYDPTVNPYFPVPPPSPSSPVSSLPPFSSATIAVPVPSVSVVPPSPPPCVTPLPELPPTRMATSYGSVLPTAPQSADVEARQETEDETDATEQAAIGRLSSMSLIAAVTAGGSLAPDIQRVFVKEVERAGKDPVYWVRREASFALGALAKVVPEELVLTLLPLFDSLRSDSVWNVRHSSLFALPAVLSRLSPHLRRSVALSTLVPLSRDESPAVRSGVLEALGEVLYTFHTDQDGPPSELLRLFLGREQPFKEQYPARPLACAFNYPAVALTLGSARWGELREYYLTLAQCRTSKVRRTLAASLGELARVIGPENAARDLSQAWEEGWLSRNWRARENLIQVLADLAGSPSHPDCVCRLLKNGLEDDFGTVRDAAIHVITRIWADCDKWAVVLDGLRRDIIALAHASSYRKRMTYVACQQSLVSMTEKNSFVVDDTNWEALRQLAHDRVVGVRIGVARLAKSLYDKHTRSSGLQVPQRIIDLVEQLRRDTSTEVRSYVPKVVDFCDETHATGSSRSGVFATFSRPPPITNRSEKDVPMTSL